MRRRARVAVTRSGSAAHAADGPVVQPPGLCRETVSTLGTGDVFHGEPVAALARDAPLADALRSANAAVALSCRALDGRSAIPTLDELERSIA